MLSLIRFFTENWRFSILLSFLVVVAGVMGASLMQRETFPPVNFAQVQITTIYPGAAPEDVQDRITRIIEDELRGIDGIKEVKSQSQNERSQIDVKIDIDRDDSDKVVNEIQRAVQRASTRLPSEIPDAPFVIELKAKEIPVYEMAIVGSNEGRKRDRLVNQLKERLEDVKGVANVRTSGYLEKELQILLKKQKLNSYAIGLTEINQALASRLKDTPAGYVDGDQKTSLVRVIGKVANPKEIENIVIRTNDAGGGEIRVKDLGRVVEGTEKPKLLTRLDGQAATLMITTKKEEADAIKTVDAVRETIQEFQKLMPEGYQIILYNDEAKRVENRLAIVNFNGIFGLFIVLLVLFIFLPGKVGFFSAMSLPICALGTLALMVYFGANFNIITMIALIICLGNLVDNSVVICEQYGFLREQGMPAQEAAVSAANQFWIPFTSSTITIVAAFLPMLVTEGVLGQFIKWIPIVVTMALCMSLLEALTLLPARLQFLNPKPRTEKQKQSGWFEKVEFKFGRLIAWTLKRKYLTLVGLMSLVLSSCVSTAAFNRFELFPAEGVEYFVTRFDMPPQTPIQVTDEMGAQLSGKVYEVLGREVVKSVISRAGVQQAEPGDALAKTGENYGLLLIAIHPEVAPKLRVNDVLDKLRTIKKPDSVQRLGFESIAGGPPVGKPLTVTLRSSDFNELKQASALVKAFTEKIEGAEEVLTDEEDLGDEYLVQMQESRSRFLRINHELVGLNLRTALEGFTVNQLTEQGNEYDIRVKFDTEDKNSIDDLKNTPILNTTGFLIPMNAVAQFESKKASPTIKSFDYRRSISVTSEVNVTKITSSAINAKVRDYVETIKAQFPTVAFKFGGEEESTNESLQSLMTALLLAILGIFATLVFTFKSFTLPFLILSTIPLGIVGVCYSFILDQRPLSFLAFIGVVGLSGVVINSAIILVDYIRELRETNPDWSLPELLEKASVRRLRAVLATGLTTIVGLLPTAIGLGGDDPLLIPITLALSWGMIVGTLLTLVWVPSAYVLLDQFSNWGAVTMKRISSRKPAQT